METLKNCFENERKDMRERKERREREKEREGSGREILVSETRKKERKKERKRERKENGIVLQDSFFFPYLFISIFLLLVYNGRLFFMVLKGILIKIKET